MALSTLLLAVLPLLALLYLYLCPIPFSAIEARPYESCPVWGIPSDVSMIVSTMRPMLTGDFADGEPNMSRNGGTASSRQESYSWERYAVYPILP